MGLNGWKMRSKNHRKKGILLLFAIIITAQVFVMIYWAHVKTGYNIDELYSMGYARGYVSQIYTPEYITVARGFCFNEWMSNETLKGYLIMKDKAMVINAPISVVIKEFLTGRNYFGLLNLAESLADNSNLSSIPGAYLNILLFVIAQIVLIRFMKTIGMRDGTICLAITMFGFSGYMISAVEFVRFYMLIILLSVSAVYLLYMVWCGGPAFRIILLELAVIVLSYFSYKNSDFYIPFFGAFMVCFILGLICKRRWKESLPLIVMLMAGILYYTYVLGLFSGYALSDMTLKVRRTVADILSPSIHDVTGYVIWLIRLFETHYFGNFVMFGAFLVVLAYCIYCAFRERKSADSVLIKYSVASEEQYMIVIAGAVFVFTSFVAICQYDVWRYYCFGFVFATVLMWFIIDRLLTKIQNKTRVRILIVLTALVAVSSLFPFKTRIIEYMYEDEIGFNEELKRVADLDVIMLLPANEETILSEELTYLSRHAIYNCVSLMPADTNILISDMNEYKSGEMLLPECFLLWTQLNQDGMDLVSVIESMESDGYVIEELGSNHDSLVYVAKAVPDK